jgi:hypothetical protein
MRGHSKRESPPPIEFIKLSELLTALQQEEADAPDPDAETQRQGLSLLGLVAATDIAATEAVETRVEGLAALYIPEAKQVIMIEDPGGTEPTEEALGLPVDVFKMSVLAHEYVHAYQDREYDLVKFQAAIPHNFDGQLAAISAVEGEATLYEYEFLFDVMDRPNIDRQQVFESVTDAAEEALRSNASPWIVARGIFPYTYGAHSAWLLESTAGPEGLEQLRMSTTTRSYIARRFSADGDPLDSALALAPQTDAGLESVVQDDLGAWLLNGFLGQVLGDTTEEALAAAQQWSGDQVSVWRGPNSEVLTNWVIAHKPSGSDAGVAPLPWAAKAQALTALTPPIAESGWLVSTDGDKLVITTSTNAQSEALPLLHAGQSLTSEGIDGGTLAADSDGGTALPSRRYQRVSTRVQPPAKPMAPSVARLALESDVRRRLLRRISPLLR